MKPILLQRHPAFPSSAATVWIRIGRHEDSLLATYRIPGDTRALAFPEKCRPSFRDNLWEHTCFELFVRLPSGSDYLEFNFSPSEEWAVYHFDEYREGMRRAPVGIPKIVATRWKTRFELSVRCDLPADWARRRLQVNLSAILEAKDGSRSYWALAHPPGEPDFHHPDCFLLDLPPPAQA